MPTVSIYATRIVGAAIVPTTLMTYPSVLCLAIGWSAIAARLWVSVDGCVGVIVVVIVRMRGVDI
jgi:hypothetical protein